MSTMHLNRSTQQPKLSPPSRLNATPRCPALPLAYASTIAMVTPPYIAAAADTVQATVDDVRSLMARHSRPAPPVAIGSTSSAVVKV